ncbi:MAG TPA: tRNA dihydrouridine synthase DusB [Bacillota bacterium]|jgi:tRNA-dihydrouridine synthase B|nr:tRNA dihydrouridine synthase DusB [Bacillota bacterium]
MTCRPWKVLGFDIGGVRIANPLVLAPMAGVCDAPFRRICKEMGCGLVYTEMISAMALVYDNRRTLEMLQIFDDERPVAVQLFGSDPDVMARAASIVERLGADILDVNMGCPAHKIVRSGEGAALMCRPELAWEIVRAVRAACGIPVTVKIRKGWDEETANAVEFAVGCVDAGADAVAVHGRTRAQGYSGAADWSVIARVARAVQVPVLGNGDVDSPEGAAEMLDETGCAAVMVGRGALGNPWIFGRALRFIATGQLLAEPSAGQRIALAMRHLADVAAFKGDETAASQMRKHLAWYIRGLRGSARVREAIMAAPTVSALESVLREYLLVLDAGQC